MDCDIETARQNLAACFRSASESYGVSSSDLIELAALAIARIPASRTEVSDWLERLALERWPGRADVRHLINQAGVGKLQLGPWHLLNQLAARTRELAAKES
jgi:hypothetical protein